MLAGKVIFTILFELLSQINKLHDRECQIQSNKMTNLLLIFTRLAMISSAADFFLSSPLFFRSRGASATFFGTFSSKGFCVILAEGILICCSAIIHLAKYFLINMCSIIIREGTELQSSLIIGLLYHKKKCIIWSAIELNSLNRYKYNFNRC